jgi:hypothetical protein
MSSVKSAQRPIDIYVYSILNISVLLCCWGGTGQVSLAVTLCGCIWKVLDSNLGPFHGSLQSLQVNAGILPLIIHGRFLPNSFSIRCSVYHSTL